MTRHRQARALIFSFILILATGCVRKSRAIIAEFPSGQKQALQYDETLVGVFADDPPTLDWTRGSDTDSAILQENIMLGLTAFNLDDPELNLQPSLASNWTGENGGRKWTFSLRTGVKWSDGVEFVAQHVLDGWQRVLNPLTGSPYGYFLYSIKNARAYSEGRIVDFKEVGVKVLGPYLLEIELEKSMSFFPKLLTHHSTFPVRKDLIDRHGPDWIAPANLVTLGPYKISFWAPGAQILLQRNDSYFGNRPAVKNLLFFIIPDEARALQLFDLEKVDFIKHLPVAGSQDLSQRPEYHAVPGLSLYFYGFRTTKVPVNKVQVRKAIAHAIDRNEIVANIGGRQSVLKSWIPQGIFGHNSELGLDFDVQKAKHLLKEAGYPNGQGFPPLTLGFNRGEKHQRVAENVKVQLKKNLNIEIVLKNAEWKTYTNNLKVESDYDIFRLGWRADYPDPDSFFNILTSYSPQNHTGWVSVEYERQLDAARAELNSDIRRRIYQQAQKLLVEKEVPAIPLFAEVNNILVHRRVENFPLNAIEKYLFKDVRIRQ